MDMIEWLNLQRRVSLTMALGNPRAIRWTIAFDDRGTADTDVECEALIDWFITTYGNRS